MKWLQLEEESNIAAVAGCKLADTQMRMEHEASSRHRAHDRANKLKPRNESNQESEGESNKKLNIATQMEEIARVDRYEEIETNQEQRWDTVIDSFKRKGDGSREAAREAEAESKLEGARHKAAEDAHNAVVIGRLPLR